MQQCYSIVVKNSNADAIRDSNAGKDNNVCIVRIVIIMQ